MHGASFRRLDAMRRRFGNPNLDRRCEALGSHSFHSSSLADPLVLPGVTKVLRACVSPTISKCLIPHSHIHVSFLVILPGGPRMSE